MLQIFAFFGLIFSEHLVVCFSCPVVQNELDNKVTEFTNILKLWNNAVLCVCVYICLGGVLWDGTLSGLPFGSTLSAFPRTFHSFHQNADKWGNKKNKAQFRTCSPFKLLMVSS